MDLKDATLMILAESAAHPTLAKTAQSAYESLSDGREVPYGVLSDMLGEASGKGIIRALRQKYSATAFEAMLFPLLREIDRQKPVRPADAQHHGATALTRSRPGPERRSGGHTLRGHGLADDELCFGNEPGQRGEAAAIASLLLWAANASSLA